MSDSAAWIGLAGVVVGGVIGYCTTVLTENRRNKRALKSLLIQVIAEIGANEREASSFITIMQGLRDHTNPSVIIILYDRLEDFSWQTLKTKLLLEKIEYLYLLPDRLVLDSDDLLKNLELGNEENKDLTHSIEPLLESRSKKLIQQETNTRYWKDKIGHMWRIQHDSKNLSKMLTKQFSKLDHCYLSRLLINMGRILRNGSGMLLPGLRQRTRNKKTSP